MTNLLNMTPKERVFGTLKNLAEILRNAPCLNAERNQLVRSLDNAISWEPELVNAEPNVELTGDAQLYRAASSDRRERG